jgi:CheY-like chemotaxis protein
VEDSGKESQGGSVLIVEDDEEFRATICEALEIHGYTVLEASDGREALDVLFAEGAPDVRLIISDLNMPTMSGTELFGVLSSYTRSSHIPVIVVSVTPPSVRPMPTERISDWLAKPFEIDALLDLVELRFLGEAVGR